LNPERHNARNAHEHCELVREQVSELAERNKLSADETGLLENVAFAHDIGKIAGSSNPKASLKILKDLKLGDERLRKMVRYHDINLLWYKSHLRGESPGDRDWRRLSSKVEVRLLLIFMIADRVDCPGGWRNNQPLIWFLHESNNRNFLKTPIIVEDNESV